MPKGPKAWDLKTAHWLKLLYTGKMEEHKLNKRCDIDENSRNWAERWHRLWTGRATHRSKALGLLKISLGLKDRHLVASKQPFIKVEVDVSFASKTLHSTTTKKGDVRLVERHTAHTETQIAQMREQIQYVVDTWPNLNPTTPLPKTWDLKTAHWRKLLYTGKMDEHKLNKKCDIDDNSRKWAERWQRLWTGRATHRSKVRLWRFIRMGYFTNSKAKDWGISDGMCSRCEMEVETMEHALWSRPRLHHPTTWLSWLLIKPRHMTTTHRPSENLIVIIDAALSRHNQTQAAILILLAKLRCSWTERNIAQFRGKQHYRGIQPIIQEATLEAAALSDEARSRPTRKQN
ncbi:hypothetical protein R1sor_027105 [Riccia sorocarpa]|uniref:Reverse transcriptase zinc-binding domain-containing protein n=1 Tax=Riccia sorocarpa TaxID=122646 RepID=A0ABD3GF03_9MARC